MPGTTAASTRPIRIGLVGFGVGGRYFHSPFIEAAVGLELAGVVARSQKNRAEVARRFPDVPIYDSLVELAAAARVGAGLDAVTITTPPHTRRDLVLEAFDLGLHVVADKPFAPSAPAGQELSDAAEQAGRILSIFHNRRWDSDIVTVRALVQDGTLGRISRFHSRMDQAAAATLEGGPTGGLLRDLGSHVVDQALWLFGPATRVYATLDLVQTSQGATDSAFVISITHQNSTTSHLSASKLNALEERELRLYGEAGSYLARTTDVQAQDSLVERWPGTDRHDWGVEPESAWGKLHTPHGSRTVPALQGDYTRYYEGFADAVRTGGTPPVTAAEGIEVLRVLDAARRSSEEGTAISVG